MSPLIRQGRAILLALAVLCAAAAATAMASANYCDPIAGCSKLKVSPSTVKAGKSTTVSGSVAKGCKTPGQVTIYSRAFKGATTKEFAGVPAVFTKANKHGKFSKKVTIKKSIKPGKYHIGVRCGGGKVGSATLKVTKH